MRPSSFFILAVLACVALFASHARAETEAFNFRKFLKGEWNIQRMSVDLTTGASTADELLGHFSLDSPASAADEEQDLMSLVGLSFDNDTHIGEISNEMALEIRFSDDNSGEFRTGADPDSTAVLFEFEFGGEDDTAVMPMSHGAWLGGEPSFYTFQVVHSKQFTITVVPLNPAKGAAARVYLGLKVVDQTEKTFFQQYGTMLMMGAFLLLQMWGSKKQAEARATQANQAGQPEEADQAVAVPDAAAAAAAAADKSADQKKKD